MASLTGPYDELFIPPLAEGQDEESLRKWFGVRVGKQALAFLEQSYGAPGVLALALATYQRERLVEVIGPDVNVAALTEDEAAARDALLGGSRVSLRLPGQEDKNPATFAPVVQRTAHDVWQVGVPGKGLTAEVRGENAQETLREVYEVARGWWDAEANLGV